MLKISLFPQKKNNEEVVRAIITQPKDLAMQTVRKELYNFLQERDLKSIYTMVLKDNTLEAEKLSEFVYRKIKEALVKEKSANAIEAPDLATNEKKEQPTTVADNQAANERLQPTNEQAAVQATAVEKTQPLAGVDERTQATAGYSPTITSAAHAPASPEKGVHLCSFALAVPNRFSERKNEGTLSEQDAKIEFINSLNDNLLL